LVAVVGHQSWSGVGQDDVYFKSVVGSFLSRWSSILSDVLRDGRGVFLSVLMQLAMRL
jgi:hypothetical protein